jgi:hypothetical protein
MGLREPYNEKVLYEFCLLQEKKIYGTGVAKSFVNLDFS